MSKDIANSVYDDITARISSLALLIVFMTTVSIVTYVVYNLYYHPLAGYPGPKTWAATRIPWAISVTLGRWPSQVRELHEKYGDVVRTAPGELSFINPVAFKDIFAIRPGHKHFPKDHLFYTREFQKAGDIVRSTDEEHARYRRLLAHSFSEKSLRDQEPLVRKYADLLISKISERCQQNQDGPDSTTINMTNWMNFITFDLIGDLAFGEPFDCLANSTLHPWIRILVSGQKAVTFIQVTRYFPLFTRLLRQFVPKSIIAERVEHFRLSKEKMDRRIASKEIRESDFLTKAIQSFETGDKGMTLEELRTNANVLVLAGSETTATVMTAVCFYLTSNPECMKKVVDEIDNAFTSEDEMNGATVGVLKYLGAVIKEGLRLYPPLPGFIPRRTPPGGDTVLGKHIPEGTIVHVPHLPAFTSSHNFRQPQEFIPERWLGDPKFADDKRDVVNPFSLGVRNCIGKNLANMEMKNILARLLWNFELHLQEESKSWATNQRSFLLWEKPDLNIKLTKRRRT